MKIQDIQKFTIQIGVWGTEYHYAPLTEWANALNVQAGKFDITALRQTLERFPKIIKTIRSFLAS